MDETQSKLHVIIDTREPIKIFEIGKRILKDFQVDRRKLEVGDIQFGSIIIERKTPNDFITSVRRPSFWSELYIMQSNYPHAFLLLDGDHYDWMQALSRKGVYHATIDNSLSAVYLMNIKVLAFAKLENAFRFLSILFEKTISKKPPRTAKLEFSKRMATLHELRVKNIMTVPRIGNVKAEELLRKYKSIYNLIKASEEQETTIDKLIYEFYCEEE